MSTYFIVNENIIISIHARDHGAYSDIIIFSFILKFIKIFYFQAPNLVVYQDSWFLNLVILRYHNGESLPGE